MELQKNNITYYSALRVCFRLYGLYLFITGFLSSLAIIPNILLKFDFSTIFLFSKGEEALYSISDLLMGIVLLSIASKITLLIIDKEKQISINSEELSNIVQILLRFIIAIITIQFLTSLIVAVGMFIILGLLKSFELEDTSRVIIPFIFLILLYIINKNAEKIANRISK